jgi:ABC-type nitrate/sulfonate/bicarbonate transport system substrate-binding protein
MKTINITLDWFPNTNHTGMYVALEKGYYANEGLDVNISGKVHGVMTTEGADIVVSPQPTLLLGMLGTEGITGVAALTQRCDSGILSLKSAGITRPRELTGKRLTHWNQEWFHRIVGKAVNDDGGDYGKVVKVPKDVGDIVATLGADADATWIYKNWEYFEMKHAGKEVNYFAFADFGELYDFCAPAVTAKHELIDNDPEALRSFLGATDRGYVDAATDPEEGAALLAGHMDGFDRALILDSQKYASTLYLDESGHWGMMRPPRWDNLADWMVEERLIPARGAREFTNEFLQR